MPVRLSNGTGRIDLNPGIGAPMNPDEIKALAEAIERIPGVKGVDFKDVRRVAELLRSSPEIGSIELKGWFGTGVVVTRTPHPFALPAGGHQLVMPPVTG